MRRDPTQMRPWFPSLGKRARASRANQRARELAREGRTPEAIEAYLRACGIDPTWSVPFYNLGLIHKYAGDWEPSLECNLRATELDPEDHDAWWNLGIAATALSRWDVARSAWRGAGIDIPDGEGPIDFPCGRTPIRLNPETEAEVVWADRLDPARASICNIPLPESGFRFGDVVLHDGAPNGYRERAGREVPVFDCLELLEESGHSTWLAEIEGDAPRSAIALLIDLADERGLVAEDWGESLRVLCKACSEGRVHSGHPEAAPRGRAISGPHQVAIAARSGDPVRRLIQEWEPRSEGARVQKLEVVLAPNVN